MANTNKSRPDGSGERNQWRPQDRLQL